MKPINIYLTTKEKATAKKVMNNYKVSLSTIAEKVSYWFFYTIQHYGTEELKEKMLNQYIIKEGSNKTSIKPKYTQEYLSLNIKHPSIFTTNALKIYLNHTIKDYITNNEGVNLYYAKIDKTLKEVQEIHWNYNAMIRQTRRALRENKEYFKKALEML